MDDTFNETKREGWARFTVAVQETIDETRLKLNPVATKHSAHSSQDRHRLPFPADLERVGQQAAIHLEHTMGVDQVNKLANDLSPQAQGALYMAGFNANAGSFSETQHLMLAKHIQRVLARVFTQPSEGSAIQQDGITGLRFNNTRSPLPSIANLPPPPPAPQEKGQWTLHGYRQ